MILRHNTLPNDPLRGWIRQGIKGIPNLEQPCFRTVFSFVHSLFRPLVSTDSGGSRSLLFWRRLDSGGFEGGCYYGMCLRVRVIHTGNDNRPPLIVAFEASVPALREVKFDAWGGGPIESITFVDSGISPILAKVATGRAVLILSCFIKAASIAQGRALYGLIQN